MDQALFRLDGCVAIVTGGARGIGRAAALAIARAGATVVAADVAVAPPHADDELVHAIPVDVSDEQSVASMVAEVERRFGRIDVLVNNAGVLEGPTNKPFHQVTLAEWDALLAINLRGPFLCARAVYPAMAQRGRGRIVNVASNLVFKGRPHSAAYVASKAGLVGLTRAMAREVGEAGITVNAVAPGLTRTEGVMGQSGFDEREGRAMPGRSIRRGAYPGDLSGAILFLASPASDFMTGQTLVVDGGEVLH